MLWKKESNRSTAMYVDYFADSGINSTDLDGKRFKSIPKSDVLSNRLREEGNIEFAARNWTNAIKAYNYALCFAENDSETLCHAYANRSACFFELDQFESCHKDIKLATDTAECSDELKQMINQHQKDCDDFIGNDNPIENTVHTPKLVFEPNEEFPCFANVLQLDRQTKFGYRITAKNDIDVGQRIFMEESMVSTLINDQYMRCSVCLTRHNNLIPCEKCTTAMFCDDKNCQSNILHATECGMTTEIDGDGKLAFLIRTVMYAIGLFTSAKELISFVEKYAGEKNVVALPMTDPRSKYQQFLKLKFDRIIASGEKRDLYVGIAYKAIMASIIGDRFALKGQKRFLAHLILQHEAIISLGCVHQYTNETGEAESLHLFPTLNQFNHSCTANAMFHLVDNWSIVTTMRPIKKGDEVTISYFGRTCYAESCAEQQEYVELLRDNFGINCQCDLCESRTSTDEERKAMQADPAYQFILQCSEHNNNGEASLDMEQVKHQATEFLRKFGQSKWCLELSMVTASFMDTNWIQIKSRDLADEYIPTD